MGDAVLPANYCMLEGVYSASPPHRRNGYMDDELARRIRRIYAALGETIETDMSQLPAYVVPTERIRGFFQDFSGGDTPDHLENTLQSLIAIVASFEYHLRRWAHHNGHDPKRVADRFRDSRPLQIIHDLWNNEKHG